MFRPASRLIARSSAVHVLPRAGPARRFFNTSTTPVNKPRSWKSSALRWGLAGAAVYYYNTSDVFAEEPSYIAAPHIPEIEDESEALPTIEALAQERQQRKAATSANTTVADATGATPEVGGVGELEEEADQQGAFNPETGEINWDCPCLGGMANGPCGEEFKAAFSCFVYSTEDPKGVDCIDRFKGMQDCFRRYPEVYGSELEDDEDDVTADEGETAMASSASAEATPATPRAEKVADHKPFDEPSPDHELQARRERAQAATEQVKTEHEPISESESAVPKAWHDTHSVNGEAEKK